MSSTQQVEITVKDKASDEVETFACDLNLLRATMTYFEPLVKKQLQEQQASKTKSGAKDKGNTEPVSLKVNCEIPIFKWLLTWMQSAAKPKLTASNAVSITLSSNFLGMHELTETALHYIKDHLADVLLSGVDMGCVPGDLLGRLCAMTTEASMANCLYTLYQRNQSRHPNRTFLAALLRHWVADRLMLLPSGNPPTPSKDPFATVARANNGVNTNGNGVASGEAARDSGLRWCRVCGVLYDDRELKRLLANDGAALSSPGTTKEPLCGHGHGSGRRSHGGGSALAARMGSRGEKLTTHAPSRLRPLPPAASTSSSSLASAPAPSSGPLRSALEVPPYSGGSTKQDLQVERWAWRLIGVTRFAVCRRCRRLVPLVDVASHACSANQARCEFVPAERFGSAGGANATDMQTLIRWYEYAGKEGVYAEVGDIKSIVCPSTTVGLMEAETIAAPACVDPVMPTNGVANEDADGDAASSVNGSNGASQRRRSSTGGAAVSSAAYLKNGGVPRAWREMPNAVSEVSAIVPAYFRPILSTRQDCPVDIDIENFHERQFFVAMDSHLASLFHTDKHNGVDGPLSTCPTLCCYPYVAPPLPPFSLSSYSTGTASPRPVSGAAGVARRAGGGGSLVLGTSLAMAKPSYASSKKKSSKR